MGDRFTKETAVRRLDASHFAAECFEGWRVINEEVMNGGYVMTIGARAMAERAERPDPISVTAHFLAPARPGPVHIVTEVVRAGGRHRTVSAMLYQGEELCVSMIGTFGVLPHIEEPVLDTPLVPVPDDLPRLDLSDETGRPVQEIFDRLEFRAEPEMSAWLRGEPTGRGIMAGWSRWEDGSELDPFGVLLLSDAYPAAVYDLARENLTWTPTIELTVHVLGRPAGEWIYADFTARTADSGYFEEDGRFQSPSGRVVATSRQIGLLRR